MSEKVRVGVFGACGRLGSELVKAVAQSGELRLVAAIVSKRDSQSSNRLPGVAYANDLDILTELPELWLDCSSAGSTKEILEFAHKQKSALVVLTTGHDGAIEPKFSAFAKDAPLLICPNASLGVLALRDLALRAQKILGSDFQIEILDIHHDAKRDAPSGTARAIAQELSVQGRLEIVSGRQSSSKTRSPSELGIASLRAGDVVGEHTVYFLGQGERVEITHRATDRAIFARGALKLGLRLLQRPPGLYRAADLT